MTSRRPGVRMLKQFDLLSSESRSSAIDQEPKTAPRPGKVRQARKTRTKTNTTVVSEPEGWCWSLAVLLQEKATQKPIFMDAAM